MAEYLIIRQQLSAPVCALDLTDAGAARAKAQEIADKVGREVVVTDEEGSEVCRVQPRRNQLIALTKN